ncbi:HPr family phosphocarrier protein [Leifsonia kafniensis]
MTAVSVERLVTINREQGLHARPALELVNAVKASGLSVTIASPGMPAVNAGSLLAVMSQGFVQGAEVLLSATGEGSDAVLERAAEILSVSD